jgi:hypothetical protein
VKGKVSIIAGLALLLAIVPFAFARMSSTEIERNLCYTEGGGKFKEIPGFPGEMIDRRLLRDVKKMKRKYNIFVTDGYSLDPVHSSNGEHPIGLALDIVPNFAKGGDWDDIDRLAKWAEPRQNEPRPPFRWVGYDGDAHHGRGHHLHLSYNHGPSTYGKPVYDVYSMLCPEPRGDGDGGGGDGDGGGDGGGDNGGDGGTSGGGSGGIGSRSAHGSLERQSDVEAGRDFDGVPFIDLGPATPETDGVGL